MPTQQLVIKQKSMCIVTMVQNDGTVVVCSPVNSMKNKISSKKHLYLSMKNQHSVSLKHCLNAL